MKVFKFSLLLLISVLLNNSLYSQVQFSIYPNGIDTICHGESLKVEAKAGYSSYHWSNGKTTRIIEVNKAGLYKCTATDQYHQTHVDSLMVYMFPKKNLSIYSNPKPAVICKGAELVLEASPGFKIYHWSNGKKGDRIVITPTLSHWLILIAVDSNACHYRDSIHIKVKICDSCDIITAWPGTSICKTGDTVILEAKSGYSSYTWSDSSTHRFLHVTKPGIYYVTTKDQHGNKCTDSIEITSGAAPLHIYSNPSPPVVCKNEKVILEATSGFQLYDWNIPGSGNRVVYVAEKSKKIILHAKDKNGCMTHAVIDIVVKDSCNKCKGIIEAWPKSVLCGEKDSVVLEAKNGYTTYLWSNHQTGRILWVYKAGWYWIEVTDSNSKKCRDSIHIKQANIPELKIHSSPNPAVICKGDTIILEASNGFVYYNWSNGHKYRVTKFAPEKSFELVLEAVTEKGCVARTTIYIKVIDCSHSLEDIGRDVLNIFPNPVKNGCFSIQSNGIQINEIQMYDLNGKEVKVEHVNNGNNNTISLDSKIKGMYLIYIHTEKSSFIRMILLD